MALQAVDQRLAFVHMTTANSHPVPLETCSANWHRAAENGSTIEDLTAILHKDAVFHSPVVHTPQEGKAITMAYLIAAGGTLGGEKKTTEADRKFRYTRIFDCGDKAVLEFETEMDGIHVNGVDLIEWDPDGKITDFKVMVRPLKAVNKVHEAMGAMLAKMKAGQQK